MGFLRRMAGRAAGKPRAGSAAPQTSLAAKGIAKVESLFKKTGKNGVSTSSKSSASLTD